MSIKGLNNILKQREEQYGFNNGVKKETSNSEEFDILQKAIATLAENQKMIYEKLIEIRNKLGE